MLAALCGYLFSGFSGGSSLSMGEQYLLASIAVVVIGGTSVAGGNGNLPGLWGAALFLFLVQSMLNTYQLSAGLRYLATGLIIIAVITAARRSENAPLRRRTNGGDKWHSSDRTPNITTSASPG